MDADKGMAGELDHSDFCSRRLRRSRLFLGLLTSGFIALSAFAAAPVDPVGQLRSEVDQVLGIAYSGQSSETVADRVRPLLEKDFTFEVVTRQAIGPGWRQFSLQPISDPDLRSSRGRYATAEHHVRKNGYVSPGSLRDPYPGYRSQWRSTLCSGLSVDQSFGQLADL
jgi:hypothetical protein